MNKININKVLYVYLPIVKLEIHPFFIISMCARFRLYKISQLLPLRLKTQ